MLRPGDRLEDKYLILEVLGLGSTGVVYKALHEQFNRVVAIKLLRPSSAAALAGARRFAREAKALSALKHPGIVRFYSFGLWNNSYPYLVMEHIEGSSLHDLLIAERKLNEQKTQQLGLQLSDALAHAHRLGFIHRDLSSRNVLIDTQGCARILDFGLCGITEQQDDQQAITHQGSLLGSLLYMSPEQCQGRPASERSDIYSLGCILYECLTGQSPCYAESNMAVVYRHVHEPPSPLPTNLGKVIMKMLEKDPRQRYESCERAGTAMKETTLVQPLAAQRSAKGKYSIGAIFKGLPGLVSAASLLLVTALLPDATAVSNTVSLTDDRNHGSLGAVTLHQGYKETADPLIYVPVDEAKFPEEVRHCVHMARALAATGQARQAESFYDLAYRHGRHSTAQDNALWTSMFYERTVNWEHIPEYGGKTQYYWIKGALYCCKFGWHSSASHCYARLSQMHLRANCTWMAIQAARKAAAQAMAHEYPQAADCSTL
jgi:hypothetical protein